MVGRKASAASVGLMFDWATMSRTTASTSATTYSGKECVEAAPDTNPPTDSRAARPSAPNSSGTATTSVLVAVLLFARSRRASDRVVSTLLAVHWAWPALAYRVAFFTSINPPPGSLAALFLVEAVLFVWWGTVQGTLRFSAESSAWAPIAWVLIAYSLAYPAINATQHGTFVRIPAFGVPCPTTIFTVGLLMLATPRMWALSIVPIVWSAIGGSAASVLGVRADYSLPLAGLALVLSLMFPTGQRRLVRKQA